jgi:hypothetical protein
VHAMHILAFFHCLLTPIPIVVLNFRFGPSSFNCFKSIKLNFIFQNWILIMSIDIARSLYLGNKKTMLSSIPNKVNVKRSNWKKKIEWQKKEWSLPWQWKIIPWFFQEKAIDYLSIGQMQLYWMDQLRKTHENLKKKRSSTKRRKRWSLVKTQPNKEYEIGRRKRRPK